MDAVHRLTRRLSSVVSMTTNPTVALLGTGTMGAGMARNIAAAGLPCAVERSQDKARERPVAQVATPWPMPSKVPTSS